jgi:hypothetical protein
MAQENGQEHHPTIQVLWDEKTQNVALRFDPKEFRSWPFMIGILEMAAKECDKQWRLSQMMQLGQQAQEQQQAQALVQKLQLGKG